MLAFIFKPVSDLLNKDDPLLEHLSDTETATVSTIPITINTMVDANRMTCSLSGQTTAFHKHSGVQAFWLVFERPK